MDVEDYLKSVEKKLEVA
jgi:hypothetical protein